MLSRPIPQPRPETRKRLKGRKQRAETKVKRAVREACVKRDGYCRAYRAAFAPSAAIVWISASDTGCGGPSEWAHLKGHRRSQTRGQAAAIRHTTKHSLMLCQRHHGMEERGELRVTYLTARGCDGPIRFTVKDS